MKAQRAIDLVAKALDHNTAVTLITTFGTKSSVMVFNASTNALIGTVYKLTQLDGEYGGPRHYAIRDGQGNNVTVQQSQLRATLEGMSGFPRGASKSRNYSRPVLREGVVL